MDNRILNGFDVCKQNIFFYYCILWAINKCRVLKLDISAVRVVEQREMETAD